MSAVILKFPKQTGRPKGKSAKRALTTATQKRLATSITSSLQMTNQQRAERNERVFLAWLDGERVDPAKFVAGNCCGILTDTYGEGCNIWRWAVDSVKKREVLRPSETERALALAIGQLNAVGLLLRLGGLRCDLTAEKDPGAHAFLLQSVADLAASMRKLSGFGTICRPSPAERMLLDLNVAEFHAAGSQGPPLQLAKEATGSAPHDD